VIILYNIIMAIIVTLVVIPSYFIRLIREEGFGERFRQSFGFIPATTLAPVIKKDCIWLHAASVGEIVATSPIVKEIRRQFPEIPILISVITVNGYAMAKQIIPEADSIIFILPDLPFQMHSIVSKIKPKIILLVETELWPKFLWTTQLLDIPVLMVNGRIGCKNLNRYHYIFFLFPHILTTVRRFCMQSITDAEYIIKLGADPQRVFVTGNTKFDQTYTNVSQKEKDKLIQQLGLKGRCPIIVAGSTHKGEEELLFSAFNKIQEQFEHAVLILAPREIRRWQEVALCATSYNLSAICRTDSEKIEDKHSLVILDTIGELGKIYSIGDIVYVGGSLVPKGGHNILEPAIHGKPILVGQYMFNFKDSYTLFSNRGACQTVYDGTDLTKKLLAILASSEMQKAMSEEALAIMNENHGATDETLLHIKDILKCS